MTYAPDALAGRVALITGGRNRGRAGQAETSIATEE